MAADNNLFCAYIVYTSDLNVNCLVFSLSLFVGAVIP